MEDVDYIWIMEEVGLWNLYLLVYLILIIDYIYMVHTI